MRVRAVDADDVRAILCFSFDHRAPVADVAAFKRSFLDSADVVHSIEATGTFDFLVELSLPDLATYHRRLAALAESLARLVARYEACFVGRRYLPDEEDGLADLWVPCRDGLRRIACRDIETVRADGDYVQVTANGRPWLVHMTMTSIAERLNPKQFLHLHRSTIVRRDCIARLIHRKNRWEALLVDGQLQRVAKSHVMATLKTLRGDSTDSEDISAIGLSRAERSHPVTEEESKPSAETAIPSAPRPSSA